MFKKFVGLVMLGTLVLLVACSGADRETPPSSEADSNGAAASQDDKQAPAFTLPAVGGGEVRLADSAGKVRLVDFWATWCAPCREEIPMLNELHSTYGERGFEILAISTEDAELIEEFMAEHGVLYTNLIGTDEVMSEYSVPGLPTGVLIDGDGRIEEVFFGPKPRRILEAKIKEMLGEG